jgi:hypothetical protein
MSVMPSPRCSFNVNGALSFEPSTWKPEGALVCGFEGAGVTGRGTDTAGLGGVVAGDLGLLLAGLLDLGMVAVFGLILVAGLDLASDCDGDLALRLIVPALDLVFALLLVFAAALAFGPDFVFFLATMRAPLPLRTTASHVATNPKLNQGRWTAGTGDRNAPATTASYTERLRDATAPASVRVVGQACPPAAQGLRTGHRTGSN